MPTGDTIIALSSAPGRSARALIRLSGPAVPDVLAQHFTARPGARGACASTVDLGDHQLPVLLARFVAPRSFTGEDVGEILLPGNPHLVARVIDRLLAHPGVRPATPGEFSARAYLNERLTLEEAEGIAMTVAAATDAELAAARRLLSGAAGAVYARWADELAALLALVEAGIDFTDQEDVVPIAPAALSARLAGLHAEIDALLGARRGAEEAGLLPRVALVGRPNAGKSTLFNALLGRRRAVESPAAGTTRDVLAEPLDLSCVLPGSGPVELLDLAGLDAGAVGAIGAAAQRHAGAALDAADVLVHCDPAGAFPSGILPSGPKPVIRVRTKADLALGRPPAAGLPVCALDGWNLATLRRAIADAAFGARPGEEATLTPRHRRTLAAGLAALEEALRLVGAHDRRLEGPELVAGALRAALDALGELTGRVSPDDVIGRVFATFCIGK